MEELLIRQSELGEAIQNGLRNFKKDSADRKNEPYFVNRLRILDTQWVEFEKNHQQLKDYEDDNSDNQYFAGQYYEQLTKIFNQYKERLNQGLASLQPQGKSTPGSSTQDALPGDKAVKGPQFKIDPQLPTGNTDNTEEIVSLVRKQKRMMATLTRSLQEVTARSEESFSVTYCGLKIQTIEKIWKDITDTDKLIWELTATPPLDYTQEIYDALDDWVQETMINLHEKLGEQRVTTSTERHPHSTLKLPQITLPVFDGNYANWTHFHDLFSQLIHSQSISNTEKMFYLTSNLTGEARSLIQHLPVTDSNYSTAWDILTSRYNNKRLLCTSFLNKLWDQPVTQQQSAASIKCLHDTTKECIQGLENIGISINTWDPIIVHLIIKKFDKITHSLYESSLELPRELPTIEGLLRFLERRFQSLEALGREKHHQLHEDTNKGSRHKHARSTLVSTARPTSCIVCKKNHPLYFCTEFLALNPNNRLNILRRNKLCINCLKGDHPIQKCTSRGCSKCAKRHNTLVHIDATAQANRSQVQARKVGDTVQAVHEDTSHTQAPICAYLTTDKDNTRNPTALATRDPSTCQKTQVLLGTVLVEVSNNKGDVMQCRAILDSGSQLSFITESLARKLSLHRIPETMNIHGIGENRQRAQYRANLVLRSRVTNYSTRLEVFILPCITGYQPRYSVGIDTWHIPKNIKLGDPAFQQVGPIDLLIGAELYYDLLSIGQIKLGDNLPTMQNTVFGWIVAGRVRGEKSPYASCGICSENQREEQQQQLERFWKLEEVESSDEGMNMTIAEQKCVNQFYQNVTRNNQGRFIVKLPFLREPTVLGESRDIALKRFLALERKLTRHPHIKEQYMNFMREYEALGHMKEINCNDIGSLHYFLPHHGVTKLDSTTTKLRVVFDASAKTSSNISLNDILSKGPTIQSELFSILIRFRFPRFVFTADIEKMYRQVLLAEEDQDYQLIMWRENPSQPIKYFKLNTVTYGLTPAPFLATKCLEHLANEKALTHPLGSEVLKRDFYVDDVMSGSNSLIEAIEIQKQLKEILSSAGFNLRKWCANHPQLLQNIPRGDVEVELNLDDSSEGSIKTLGLTWLPRSDVFCIKTTWEDPKKVTKRTVLSDISHIFDPLGFMSPVTITAKLFIKKLWALKLDWDASLPMEMHTSWLKFRESLQLLNDIKIPRHIAPSTNPTAIQIHVFSDASEAAYGTAIFVRAKHTDGRITVRLLCAKSKIAPSKTITLPRLELCAAKLAAQLAHRITTDIKLPGIKCYFWTDSEIVLAWLNSESSSYHTFVANRVASIQRLSDPEQWRHVPSKENPADIVSRGMSTERLANCNLWLYGPTFLHGSQAIWPAKWTKTNTDLEKRKAATVVLTASSIKLPWISEINHGNSFKKLQRIVAYVLRFVHSTRKQKLRRSIFLTAEELEEAVSIILAQVQQEGFKEDLQQLRRSNCVDTSSSLSSLSPFIDERGLIRVGGRLENSNLTYNAKHPVLLPYAHQLTKLLMTDIHLSNLHVGPQALLAITRQRFWPIKGKTIARSIVQQCIRCNKAKPKLMTQLMGNLPSTRIQPARPFINSGVDFCGPIQTHFKIRGKQPQKSYIAVYCCFSTKAVHLEIASDLTTESFLGTLKRFIARRGHCRRLYCDNATNFVGANNQLKELQSTIYAHNAQQKIVELCQSKGIDFTFIPPRAPHFGGLWEAAVKSAKSLMQRTIASASLTYEELSTVAAEIEAILNSRPITPLSSDPNDLTALTPGHFLIGEPLTTIVEPQSVSQPVSLIKRWKLVSHIKQEFWRRWTNEYLSELQHRHKWKNQGKNAQPGMLVLIKEDNLPPLKWQLGRIIHTIKGDDGLVRVADIKTTSGISRRPIHKLAPLPLNVEEHSSCELLSEDSSLANNHNRDPIEHTHPRSESRRNQEDTEDQPRSKRTRTSNASLSLLLLTCFILPIMGSSSVQVTPFDSQPGIYFESLGAAHLTSNEWKLIVYYNMNNYWKEFTTINRSINQLQSICDLLSEGDVCKILTNQFNRLRQEIVSNNELLSPTSTSVRTRSRRAPLNIIGNIASSLFGVLDSEYAERLSITIDSIRGNEAHLLQLIKNQTSLIDSTANVLRRAEEAFQTQLRDVDYRLNQIIDHINNFTERQHQQKMTELFSTLALEVILMSSNYQRAQTAIIDVLVDTHHGKINPLLLTPTQLKQELTTIKDHLPSTLRLPARQDDILQLYHLMKIEGRATSKHIIFQIKLPLFALEEFEIFHIIPVPVLVNQSFVAIKPTADFMIVNLHRDQYYPLTKEEFKACVTIGETDHMCTQRHPIYRKGANISACELGFITNSAPSTSCEVLNAENSPKWIQLFNPNQWIYSVKEPTILTTVCGSTMSQLRVTGAGILKIQEKCEIKQDFLTLRSHNIYPKITSSSFVPTDNLTDFITPERLAPIKHSSHQFTNHLQELKVLREQIQEIHRAEKLPNQINPTSIHQFTIGYAALILGIILSGVLGYVRWKTHKGKSTMKAPIPKPRTSVGPQFTINIDEDY